MKKLILALLTLTTCFAFVSCNKEEKPKDEPFCVDTITESKKAYFFGASDNVSIMQDIDVYTQSYYWGDEWLENTDRLYGDGIKGDTIAMQLQMNAKKDIAAFDVTSSDLTNSSDQSVIDSSNVELLAEKYIQVKASSSNPRTASMFTGWYPDCLVPMANYKIRKENKIAKGNNQGIWINVKVPTTANAGTYTGKLSVTLDGEITQVDYSVKVYDVSMPTVNHCCTAIDIWENEIGFYEEYIDENDQYIDWNSIYYEYLLSKKITPQHIPNDDFSQNYVKRMVEYAQNDRVTKYRLTYKAESHDFGENGVMTVVSYSSILQLLTWMAQENITLRQNGDTTTDLFKKAFFYFASIIDEPTASKTCAVKYCDNAVFRAKEEVAKLLKDYPDLVDSVKRIPHVVTTTYRDFLIGNETDGGVQTWCTECQNASQDYINGVRERLYGTNHYSIGEGSWVYLTCTSNNPYPSMQLDDNVMGLRILQWMRYDYGFQCMLFWNTTYWQKHTGGNTVLRDIWNDPQSWETANGDGCLLYPGSKYGLDHPLGTVRLEILSQGSEDYEYFWMIEQILTEYNKTSAEQVEVLKVINKLAQPTYSKGTLKPTTNLNKFINARTNLLQFLEDITTKPDQIKTLVDNLLN